MVNTGSQTSSNDDKRQEWQLRVLPFMVRIIIGLALFFFLATMYQLYELNTRIEQNPMLEESELLLAEGPEPSFIERQWRSLVLLESHILQQRYHQANVLLMARIWVRYLGFVTGMMLSLIGAVFILGKLREPGTELTLEGRGDSSNVPGNLKVQLVTQSPGIVLVTLGSVLMLVTILVHHEIEVNDAPVYTSVSAVGQSAQSSSDPAKLDLDAVRQSNEQTDDQTRDLMDKLRERQASSVEENSQ